MKRVAYIIAVAMLMIMTLSLVACSPEHECTPSDKWDSDDMAHWHPCVDFVAGCLIWDYADHQWDDGEVTKSPTATETGVHTYTCTVCGHQKNEDIERTSIITEELWADAVILEGVDNFVAVEDCPYDNAKRTYAYNGTIIYLSDPIWQGDIGEGNHKGNNETYMVDTGTEFIKYVKRYDATTWTVSTIDQGEYENALPLLNIVLPFEMEDFTYNETTGAYVGDNVVIDFLGITFEHVELSFENGKLVKFDYVIGGERFVSRFTYGTAQITLPQIQE